MNKHIHQDDRKPGERCPICGDSSCPERQATSTSLRSRWRISLAADRIEALEKALTNVMPLLAECDCIHSDREAPLCPCRAARALLTQFAGRAAVPPWVNGLRVHISSIPHKNQRYDTCGDWFQRQDDLGQLVINVSYLPSRREMFLVAIHELIEAFLCECAGITQASVDKFDKEFSDLIYNEDQKDLARPGDHEWEPGDDIRAPYYKQHQFASGIERILAAEAGVDWLTYEQHIKELK